MPKENEHTFAIPAYKESLYLEECILSLKKQTVRSDILIVTSTLSRFLEKIAEKHGVPLIVNNKRSGIASDWSFAYNSCHTKYVTLAHQDDIYLPHYTKACLASLARSRDDSIILFTDYSELKESGRRMNITVNLTIKKILLFLFVLRRKIRSRLLKRVMLAFGSPISCPSVMYNKSRIGSFYFADDLTVSLDWDAWLRLADLEGSFIYVARRLMLHRIHRDTQTTLQVEDKIREREDRLLFQKIWPPPIAGLLSKLYAFSTRSNDKS